MSSSNKPKISGLAARLSKRFIHSIWLFPAVLLIPLLVLTILQISGTSIGTYHEILYGDAPDKSLIANKPEAIRSDEWLVNTQQTIAQAKSDFPRVNKNIGNGEDLSTTDVPVKDWSVVFKPHDLIFFILPLGYAFTFKWWLIGYLLIISCYFFTLEILPRKRLLAAGISTALFFSAFVQWWYLYGTLSPLYYSFFIAIVVMHLCKQQHWRQKLMWGALLAYLIVCFALVLYPPFQIACGLVAAVFLVGYAAQNYSAWGKPLLIRNVLLVLGSGILSAAIIGAFVFSRLDVIKTTEHTAYPGSRSLKSGQFFPIHFMSSQLGYQFISDKHTAAYLIDGKGHTNQSEASNFLLLTPFLFAPSVLLVYYERRRKLPLDWPLLLLNVLFIVFLFELFVPAFTPVSKLLLLNEVGGSRLLIGMGLLNIIAIVLFIRNLSKKKFVLPNFAVVGYCGLILAVELALNFHAHVSFPGFIDKKDALAFALPLPLVMFLLLKKRFTAAILVYLAFSVFISVHVNPLYKGLDTITKDPLSTAVAQIGSTSNKRWISDGGYLENIASINGVRSLSGVYDYPQLSLWDKIPKVKVANYNRYAHVGFVVSDNPATPTSLQLIEADSFEVTTSGCSDYLRQLDVGFLVSSAVLHGGCTTLEKTVSYPLATLYIYKLEPR